MSVSLYKGQQVIENLADYDIHEFSEDRRKNREFESVVASLSVEPIEGMLNLSFTMIMNPATAGVISPSGVPEFAYLEVLLLMSNISLL